MSSFVSERREDLTGRTYGRTVTVSYSKYLKFLSHHPWENLDEIEAEGWDVVGSYDNDSGDDIPYALKYDEDGNLPRMGGWNHTRWTIAECREWIKDIEENGVQTRVVARVSGYDKNSDQE